MGRGIYSKIQPLGAGTLGCDFSEASFFFFFLSMVELTVSAIVKGTFSKTETSGNLLMLWGVVY